MNYVDNAPYDQEPEARPEPQDWPGYVTDTYDYDEPIYATDHTPCLDCPYAQACAQGEDVPCDAELPAEWSDNIEHITIHDVEWYQPAF